MTATAALGIFSFVALETLRLERETTNKLALTLDKSRQTFTEANRFLLEAGITARNLREASAAWKDASRSQTEMIARTGERVDALLADSDALVRRTDETLNAKIGPQAAGLLGAANATVNGMTMAAEAAGRTISDADRVVTDPNITAVITNTAKVSENVASTSKHLDASAGDIEVYIHRITKPSRMIWGVVKTVLGLGAQVALIVK